MEPDFKSDGSQQAPPYIADAEIPTFLDVFVNSCSFLPIDNDDLEDISVCDLACGNGFYTRQIRQLTRGRVVGVDASYD